MPVRLVPESPQFTTASEQLVWDRLVHGLPDGCTVIANLRLTDADLDHEADVVVVAPGVGIVVLEVKGAGVAIEAGRWTMRHDGRARPIDPVRQAQSARYAIRNYAEVAPQWANSSRTRFRMAHAVVTPFTELDLPADLPECPRWMVLDKRTQDRLSQGVLALPARSEERLRVPDEDDCDLVVDILTGRFISAAGSPEDISDERLSRADRLTQEQQTLLKVTRLLNRVEVRGGAGSGKTVLAMTQAKQLAAGRDGRPQQRVALLCYSIGLATFFRRETATWQRKEKPAFVGTYADLAESWGIPLGDRDDKDFWEEKLAVLMAERAERLAPGERFDAFVVDESQDFAESWWRPLLKAMKDEETGGLFVYSDQNQALFPRFGPPPVPLAPLVLDHNLRNTRQIADIFKPLAPTGMRPMGGDGPDVVFVPCAADEAVVLADEQAELLLDEGWSGGHVALLTTGKRHSEQENNQVLLGQAGYWEQYWGNYLFYGHVLGFKGMERRAVVLCVNEDGERERFKERLYVGLSRATDRLVVVGDPEVIAKADARLARELLARAVQ